LGWEDNFYPSEENVLMAFNKIRDKLNGRISVNASRVLVIVTLAFCGYLVTQIDNLRDMMPQSYVLASAHEKDYKMLDGKIDGAVENQNRQIDAMVKTINDKIDTIAESQNKRIDRLNDNINEVKGDLKDGFKEITDTIIRLNNE
jgi:peptidoglycan hydrolase CwlO-like protein